MGSIGETVSELRDLAAALSAVSKSLTSIENHVAEQNANCVQLRQGLHELRNQLQADAIERGEREKAIEQVQTWMGDFSRKLGEVHEMVTNVQANLHDTQRGLSARIGELEDESEVTQS